MLPSKVSSLLAKADVKSPSGWFCCSLTPKTFLLLYCDSSSSPPSPSSLVQTTPTTFGDLRLANGHSAQRRRVTSGPPPSGLQDWLHTFQVSRHTDMFTIHNIWSVEQFPTSRPPSLSPHPPPFLSCRRGAVLRGYWLWTSWLTGVRPVRWNTWCRSSSPSSRETSYPCCPKRCEHYTQAKQSVSHLRVQVDVPKCDL